MYARDNQKSQNNKQSREPKIVKDKLNYNKKLENNTISPQKNKRSEILSEEIKVVNKVRKLVSEKKIVIDKAVKTCTVIFN